MGILITTGGFPTSGPGFGSELGRPNRHQGKVDLRPNEKFNKTLWPPQSGPNSLKDRKDGAHRRRGVLQINFLYSFPPLAFFIDAHIGNEGCTGAASSPDDCQGQAEYPGAKAWIPSSPLATRLPGFLTVDLVGHGRPAAGSPAFGSQ